MPAQDLLPKPCPFIWPGDCEPGTAQPEEDEVIEIKFFPLSTALRMVMNGRIHDGKTISGVLWLSQKLGCRTKPK